MTTPALVGYGRKVVSETAGNGGTTEPRPDQRGLAAPPKTSESLDRLVTTTTTAGWIAVAMAIVGMVAAAVWAFVAEIPQSVEDSAVTSAPDTADVVVSPVAGTATISAAPGDSVTTGQPVATVTPFDGGSPVTIAAPRDGTVQDASTVNGQGVQPGTELLVVDAGSQSTTTLATTFVPANRAEFYTPESDITVEWTDLSSGRTFSLPGSVQQVFNIPADESSISSTAKSVAVARAITDSTDGLLYRVQITVKDLDTIAPEDQPIDGQLMRITNTYARTHPIQLLFGS